MGKVISGGGKYFTEKFKLGKIEGQILAGDKKAGLGPEKSGGPADPDPKAKKVARIIGSGGKVLASRESDESSVESEESREVQRVIGSGTGKILSSRIQGEEGKLYSEIKK
jgi:hypothetical protein